MWPSVSKSVQRVWSRVSCTRMSIRRLSCVAGGEKAHVRRAGVLFAVLVLAGCNGGTVDRHALTNDASTLASRLWQLHDHPTDRDGAERLAGTFKQAGSCS